MVRIYGFDWGMYARRVMPAFARWFVDEDEQAIYRFYEQTRCAREEDMIPAAMQHQRTWSRAQAFMRQLPHGPYAYREYRKLCSAEQFTELSDLYVYRHPPQLYYNNEAIRIVWGAIIEEYCIVSLFVPIEEIQPLQSEEEAEPTREELLDLLHAVGLDQLAGGIDERPQPESQGEKGREMSGFEGSGEGASGDAPCAGSGPLGIQIGRHPTTLHLRGWLASISVRAMALFELLACGRRCMPFGYRSNEPFESYIGYLTPDEVWRLALCLRSVRPPDPVAAEEDYRRFRLQRVRQVDAFRMIDEVLPAYGSVLVRTVRQAATQGLGLICSVE
ncbi:MAG: hypothetical protein IMW89_12140 [Ktedonobacteraceae bacterium]|nr:hypothetical protein [Ktedonobacteraceae bacterium]